MKGDLYLGIDFSGNHLMWRSRCTTSNVWIAEVLEEDGALRLHALRRAQELLPLGEGSPFDRLTRYLAESSYRATAIDAPFSIPKEYLRGRSHAALVSEVAALPRSDPGRPFPEAKAFVREIAGREPCAPQKKPLRRTERECRGSVNVRSSLWAGARGGAAMTAACLTLLSKAKRPIWPWAGADNPGLLVEGFPTAQLGKWSLPHDGYNGASKIAEDKRSAIVRYLEEKLHLVLDVTSQRKMKNCADALDAVVCAFGARAVVRWELAHPLVSEAGDEGWIAVHA
jgi:predicted nuclease with RNAse H fold